jgi:iron complex outermembrane receptor protein
MRAPPVFAALFLGLIPPVLAQQDAAAPAASDAPAEPAPPPAAPTPAAQPAPAPATGPQASPADGSPAPQKERGKRRKRPPASPTPEPPGGQLESIVVQGHTQTDLETRRDSTAAKMVFGREELDRYGDSSIGEVLKRLPGITISGRPGRGGDIRMRGLGHGYTQVLINGDPAPRGFSLDTLAPEQVERIEIYRAPIAEHSARAIAGTINIVLREELRREQTELRLTGTEEKGHLQPGISLQRSDNQGRFGYNLTLNAFGRDQASEVTTTTIGRNLATGSLFLQQQEFDDSHTTGEGIHLTARLTWHLDGGDVLDLNPFLMQSRSPSAGFSLLAQPLSLSPGPGQPVTPQPFALADWVTETDMTIARVGGDWQHAFGGGAKLRLRFLFGLADNDSTTQEAETGLQEHQLFSSTGIHDKTLSNGGKLTLPVSGGGDLSGGWDLEYVARQEGALNLQDGVQELAQFGSDIEADVLRVAGFGQRDWTLGPDWSAYAGLRWEGLQTTSSALDLDVRNTSSVWSPILQSLWKLGAGPEAGTDDERPDQLRLALARTYRAPGLNSLVARPSLSKLYPVSGANAPNSPDQLGNPELRPEVAWGLDAAFERYLPQGGLLSASAFHRRIESLMRTSTSLETVSWSPVQRWVSQPQNVGQAQASGIELEAKLRLAELMADAPPIDLRSNYSRFWSSVSQIPGPNNRLDQQPRQTANFGLDDHLRGLPITLGLNYNWTPAFEVQQSANQIYGQGLKRVLDGYALWVVNPATRLRVSVSNALHRDYETSNTVLLDTPAGPASEDADAVARSYIAWSVRLEIKL